MPSFYSSSSCEKAEGTTQASTGLDEKSFNKSKNRHDSGGRNRMSGAPPVELIGRFGEYFASKWLEKEGFELRRFRDLQLKFSPALQDGIEEYVPEPERRRRLVESYETRIPILEGRLIEAEHAANVSQKVKNWITREREHLKHMKQALIDVKEGRRLESITEYPTQYPVARKRYHSEPWRVFEEVPNKDEAREFLGPRVDNFTKYMDECERIRRAEFGGPMYPDIVAKKEGDVYLVEVKANGGRLAPLQRRALELAAKFGFKTKVIRVKFEANCEEARPHHPGVNRARPQVYRSYVLEKLVAILTETPTALHSVLAEQFNRWKQGPERLQ